MVLAEAVEVVLLAGAALVAVAVALVDTQVLAALAAEQMLTVEVALAVVAVAVAGLLALPALTSILINALAGVAWAY
jgi:hypothetical protein